MWEKGTEIAIWGTGKIGRRVYLKYHQEYTVKYFIDNYPKAKSIDNVPVVKPEEIREKNIRILIGVSESQELCRQCRDMGKKAVADYMPYDLLDYKEIDFFKVYDLVGESDVHSLIRIMADDKKIALMIGNCQTPIIRKLLQASKQFVKDYIFISLPPVHLIDKREEEILEKCKFVFKNCDICITQKIADNNTHSRILSTNLVKEMLGEKARLLMIPTLYFDIYFPQTFHQNKQIQVLNEIGILSFPYGDCILDELVKRYTAEEIAQIVQLDNLFSAEFMKIFETMRICDLRQREQECDVHILDYILERYKAEPLFYSKNHPKLKVLIELAERLLKKIGYDDFDRSAVVYIEPLDAWDEVIYPSVRKGLNLQFEKNVYRDPGILEACDFSRMIQNYISYIYKKG